MIKIAVNFKDENAAQVRSKQSGEFFFSLLIFPLTHCMVLLGRNAYKQCGRGSQSIPPGTRPLLWNVWVDPDCHKCLFIRLCKRTSHIQWELIKIWSGRASERGIRRSEVRFLVRTQNFFYLCSTLVTRRKISFFIWSLCRWQDIIVFNTAKRSS